MFGSLNLCSRYASLYHKVVASCPQDKTNVIQNVTVEENIKICKPYAICKELPNLDEYIDYLLDMLKLKPLLKSKYSNIAGGMQRRLSLLLSLIRIPQILLLDEITANVDPLLKHDIWDVLNDFQKRFNRSIIMTSHDSYELQYVCSHIVHIDAGNIVVDAKVE